MPVIQARPVISGITAGRPATVVSSTTRPVKRVPMTDSLTNGSPAASSPRACSWARRALVPVPHGERSSQPGWIDVAARGVGAVAARLVEDDVVAAGDPRVLRVDRAVGGVDRRHHLEARRDQLAARAPDRPPGRVGRRRDRVEVAAVGHVVGDLAEARDLDERSRACRNDGDVADRHRRARGRSPPARAPRPARPGRPAA